MWWSVVVCCAVASAVTSIQADDSQTMVIMPEVSVPVEGNNFSVQCVVRGGSKSTDVKFTTNDNSEVKNSPDRHRVVTKSIKGNSTQLTMSWNPLRLTDTEVEQLNCANNEGSYGYNIFIMPKKSIPVFSRMLVVTMETNILLKCSVSSIMVQNKILDVSIEWRFKEKFNEVKNDTRFVITENKSGTDTNVTVSSELLVRNADETNAGTYYCTAVLVGKHSIPWEAFESIVIKNTSHLLQTIPWLYLVVVVSVAIGEE